MAALRTAGRACALPVLIHCLCPKSLYIVRNFNLAKGSAVQIQEIERKETHRDANVLSKEQINAIATETSYIWGYKTPSNDQPAL